MDEPFLQVRGLWKHFGGVQALKGVDLEVRAGEVHGLEARTARGNRPSFAPLRV